MTEAQQLAAEMTQAVEQDLRGIVDRLEPSGLREMVSHHFGWLDGLGSGKGIRPLVCLLACAAAGDEWRRAIPAASSIELIHNFSLIHDDIQDRSEQRRHRDTVWKLWGDAQAINTGDALFALARLSSHRLLEAGVEPRRVLEVQRVIDQACLELTKGQHLDLAFDATDPLILERYLHMIEAKTSSLLAASAAAGAVVGGADPDRASAYRQYGLELGLAFQITDDILGTWGAPDETGKSDSDDLTTRKPTYPALYAYQASSDFARLWRAADSQLDSLVAQLESAGAQAAAQAAAAEHTQRALGWLEQADAGGPAGVALRGLADRLLERQN